MNDLRRAYRKKKRKSKSYRQNNVRVAAGLRRRLATEVAAIKAKTPCADCDHTFNPWQMQFDHVRGKKLGNVSYFVGLGMRRMALAEMDKCELVCANCHANRSQVRYMKTRNP